MATPKIELKGIKKHFGPKKVLDGITLNVNKGESLVIIGGSGTGKSVLLKCILGLLTPDEGSVFIDGEEVTGLRGSARVELMRKFGMLFQGGALFDSLPVWENITFAVRPQKGLTRTQARDLAVEKLAAVGLGADVAQLSPAELSGGMQKRVALARAICANPDIIFFDEPTTGLDPIMADVINDLIIDCTRKLGLTTLSITHDMVSAAKIATDIAMLYQGKLIWQGAAKDIRASNNPYVDQFVHGRAHGPITDEKKGMKADEEQRASSSYFTYPLLIILFLGFSSGLPLGLTASTLTAWLFESGVHRDSIGFFAAVATPYSLKFLWSPLMDSLPVPVFTHLLGRRRGWILFTQILLALGLGTLATTHPAINAWYTACAAVLVAFLSASQDIVIDAYRVEILDEKSQGKGAAMVQLGYRLGMVASSAGALYLAAKMGWQGTYMIMAACIGIGMIATLLAREPHAPSDADAQAQSFKQWISESVIAPFADFMRHPSWVYILIFIVVYKFADAFIGGMTNPFLLDIGFKKEDIAEIVKIYGTIATLLGTFLGGSLTVRYGPIRIMFVAGLLHGVTNLLYVMQAQLGPDAHFLALSTAVENFTGGISAAAFVAYLSLLTNVHYTATQYALLSSLAALGRTWFSTPAGIVSRALGWQGFFALSALLALPGLILLIILNKRLQVPKAT